MDLNLNNKLALVTGSTKGIGKEIARTFLKEGAKVIVHGSSAQTVDPTVEELKSEGDVKGIAADLSTDEDVNRLCAQVEEIGELDILVNNAAIFEVTPFEDIDSEKWHHYFQVNLISVTQICRHFLPQMLERNSGRILMVASEAGVKPVPFMLHYSTTKTALIGLARGLAELTQGSNVTVNSLLPGPTLTQNVKGLFEDVAEQEGTDLDTILDNYFEEEEPTSLLQRFETPEEVAKIAVFLCSDAASIVNGSAQRAEGGIIRSVL